MIQIPQNFRSEEKKSDVQATRLPVWGLKPWVAGWRASAVTSEDIEQVQNHGLANYKGKQGFGSGSVSGSGWNRINLSCWIRIRIRIQIADPDPDPGGLK